MTTIGILGAGQLAEMMVRGLQGTDYRFILSPRGADTARRLADTHGCAIAASNQEVVDRSEGVFVALPAASGMAELSRLCFRAGQPVLSAMAGTRADALAAAIGPACGDMAMMPGYANALRIGPSILFPGRPFWQAFLGCVGPVLVLETEERFVAAAAFAAIQVVPALTIAADRALDRNFIERSVLASNRVVAVVENQLHAGLRDRLARRAAGENHVGQ